MNLDWLAGFIDGDGTFCLLRNKFRHKHYLKPRFAIVNTSRKTIEEILKSFDFKWKAWDSGWGREYKGNRKNSYLIAIEKQEHLIDFLNQIIPHLVMKKQRAELLREFCISRFNKRHMRCPYSLRELEIFKELKKLNMKGRKGMNND